MVWPTTIRLYTDLVATHTCTYSHSTVVIKGRCIYLSNQVVIHWILFNFWSIASLKKPFWLHFAHSLFYPNSSNIHNSKLCKVGSRSHSEQVREICRISYHYHLQFMRGHAFWAYWGYSWPFYNLFFTLTKFCLGEFFKEFQECKYCNELALGRWP